jgi:hypothetical protein
MRTYFDIRLLKEFKAEEVKFLNLMFHRRHVYEHCGGVADQRYLDEAGDESIRLGQALRETKSNAQRFGALLKNMAANLDEGFHQIFPPNETAVRVCGGGVRK